MAAITNSAPLNQIGQASPVQIMVPVVASKNIFMGQMVALVTASGYATDPGSTTNAVMGVAEADAKNSAGSSGDMSVNLRQGQFYFPQHATHVLGVTNVGGPCYASDNHTVSDDPTDGPVAGIVLGIDATMGVLVHVDAGQNQAIAALAAQVAALTALTAGAVTAHP